MSGTCSSGSVYAGTGISLSIPNSCLVDTVMSGSPIRFLEQPERIVREELPAFVLGRPRWGALAVHADLPGGAVAGNGLLLVPGDGVFAHSGKKIVGMIVLAHMLETKTPIFAFAQASF